MGWQIKGKFDPQIKKCIVIVLPHTSWHDFYIGIFTRGIVELKFYFIAKRELFRFPFGAYFKLMGGTPIDRKVNKNKVDTIAEIFATKTVFRLVLSPEGTRQKVSELRSGFYYIALKSNVPIIPVAFDFGTKTVNIAMPFYPTSNYESDLPILMDHFEGAVGKNSELGFIFKK